ncbi:MAG: cysteine desulfurase [Verrucomicrobiales bacterium]|nr:cysteine desulfurase [Verrucomicrobiales bacterium]
MRVKLVFPIPRRKTLSDPSHPIPPAAGHTPLPRWEKIRRQFPILAQSTHGHPLLYLDNAASSQKPQQVIDTLRHYYEHENANVHRGLYELSARATDAYEGARKKVAAFLGSASPEEIIFTRGTTESVNLVAQSWAPRHLKAGDVILLTELEHHSNLVPWQMAAERTGAVLRFIPVRLDDGELDLEKIDELLGPEVKLFAFTQASNSLGTLTPAAALCRLARERGITTLVDGAQSAGHFPVNVSALGCDFFACSGHKMCAPTGIGILYGRRELLDAMPPWHGGGEMIETVRYERSTYKAAPQRFEAGTPHIAGAIGLGAACDYLSSIGLDAIAQRDAELTDIALEQMAAIPGLRILGPKPGAPRGALVSFVMEQAHPHDLVTYAAEYGLALRGGHHCTQPLMRKLGVPGTARASFYFYNTPEEISRMTEILTAAQRYFS